MTQERPALYPLFADLRGRTVLVAGGGEIAARKVAGLLEAGACVRVGAPQLEPGLAALAEAGRIEHLAGGFVPDWLDGAWLAIAATADAQVNAQVAAEAEARRIFANVVDDAAHSAFHVPARLRRGALTVAISSGGRAPGLARRLRAELEVRLDAALGELAELLGRHRRRLRRAFPDPAARNHLIDDLVDGPVGLAFRRGRAAEAEAAFLALLEGARPAGHVVLVGAGPGDPDLVSVKGLRALQRADVIVHDRLVSPELLARARRDALLVDVGKRVGEDHAATQERIHHLLVQHARAGRRVVRLKGGDPLVFGRGGEELEHLRAHGIAYEVVPGITAALACAAHAGVPLTHREHSAALHLATTRRRQPLGERDWCVLAEPGQTLALYMAAGELETIPGELIRHGRAPDTPCVVVENGSEARQRTLHARLDQLAAAAREHAIRAPSILIVGEVAALAPELAWFGEVLTPSAALAEAA